MKVSVCITTYNLEKYIGQTLDSILSQKTNFDFEILIGDDASSDSTPKILKEYEAKYPNKIKFVLHKRNVGVNRNDYSLISLAQGEYIAWCDGDDHWINDNKLQEQADILDSHPECSGVHSWWRDYIEAENRYHDIKQIQHEWEKQRLGKQYAENILLGRSSGTRFSSLMFRSEILKEFFNKYGEEYLRVPHKQNDLAYFCILGAWGPFYLQKKITTVYRIRKESLSMAESEAKRINYYYSLMHLLSYLTRIYNIDIKSTYKIMHPTVNACILALSKKVESLAFSLNDIELLCLKAKYRLSAGERIIVLSIKHRYIKSVCDLLIKAKSILKKQ